MTDITFKSFNYLTREEKELVLKWRNSDRIRLKMVNQDIIPYNEHINWLEGLKNRTDCKYYLAYLDDTPFAVCDLTSIDEINKTAFAGSYVGDEKYLGYGVAMQYFSFQMMFEIMKFNIIYSNVLKTNPRVYKHDKNILFGKDKSETKDEWILYWDIEAWEKLKKAWQDKMKTIFEIDKFIID